jgi:hypothetical protein
VRKSKQAKVGTPNGGSKRLTSLEHHVIISISMMSEGKMIRTQVQLTDDQARELRELAYRNDVPMAELIRQAIDEMLSKGGHVSGRERRRRLLSIAGKYDSGLTDVSARHDDYLDAAYAE